MRFRVTRHVVLQALLLGISGLSLAPTAMAASSPNPTPSAPQGVSVTPATDSPHRSKSGSFLELGTVVLGQPVHDVVLVRSTFDRPQQVSLYGADAQPAVGGGFGFAASSDKETQVGAWLRLTPTSVSVPAHGQVRVLATVTVPQGTSGGEYVGGVVAEPVEQGPVSAIQTRFRFAMAVYLRVPGAASGATPGRGTPGGRLHVLGVLPDVHGALACPKVQYRNDSQDIIDPQVAVRTEGLFGSSYSRSRTGALLPGSSATVPLPCLKRPLGPGRLQVTLRSPRGNGSVAVDFTWWPTALVVGLLLLLLLIVAVLVTLLRGRRRRGRDSQVAPFAIPPS
ncbi:MAG: hypothetical protein NVS3B26_24640 [Mycobacteriales bacterium]